MHQKEHKIVPHKKHADQEDLVLEQKYFELQLPLLKIIQEKILLKKTVSKFNTYIVIMLYEKSSSYIRGNLGE